MICIMFSICEIYYTIFNYICPLNLAFEYEFIKISVNFSEFLNGGRVQGQDWRKGRGQTFGRLGR